MWKSLENVGLQTSEKVSGERKEKKKHAQNIRSGDISAYSVILCATNIPVNWTMGNLEIDQQQP